MPARRLGERAGHPDVTGTIKVQCPACGALGLAVVAVDRDVMKYQEHIVLSIDHGASIHRVVEHYLTPFGESASHHYEDIAEFIEIVRKALPGAPMEFTHDELPQLIKRTFDEQPHRYPRR